MSRYVTIRLLTGLFTLVLSSILIFLIIRLIPGDPGSALFGTDYSPEAQASLQELYGLDRPIVDQYGSWVAALTEGNFGYSLITRTPVIDEFAIRIPRTLLLLGGGITVGLLISVPAAFAAAVWRGRWPDTAVTASTSVLLSVPQFWLGLLLLTLFAVKLRLLPPVGYVDPAEDLIGALKALILPWVTIGLGMAAFVTRTLRSSLLDVLDQNYVRTARARGLSEWRVLSVHVFKNAAIPTMTVVGLEVGYLLGGAIVVEQVFSYPGMGQLIVGAVLQRDYPTLQACLLFFTAAFILVNVLVDLSYAVLDPRVRARLAT